MIKTTFKTQFPPSQLTVKSPRKPQTLTHILLWVSCAAAFQSMWTDELSFVLICENVTYASTLGNGCITGPLTWTEDSARNVFLKWDIKGGRRKQAVRMVKGTTGVSADTGCRRGLSVSLMQLHWQEDRCCFTAKFCEPLMVMHGLL